MRGTLSAHQCNFYEAVCIRRRASMNSVSVIVCFEESDIFILHGRNFLDPVYLHLYI